MSSLQCLTSTWKQDNLPGNHSPSAFWEKGKAGIMSSFLTPTDLSPKYSRQSEYKGYIACWGLYYLVIEEAQ